MSKKIRVHELAKEYGWQSQDFVTKLRELGFANVKGPQSTFDEFELLHVEGTLAAHEIRKAGSIEASLIATAGLTIKKKKKKINFDPDPNADDEVPSEPAPEPTPVVSAPTVESTPEPVVEVAPLGRAHPIPSDEPPAPASEPASEATVEPAPSAGSEPLAPAASTTHAPQVASQTAPSGGLPPPVAAALPSPTAETIKPVRKPAGKVVGFVDLSKIQAPPRENKSESRRLRSKDDVAPDVNPTLGHDRKKALQRGDQASRGQMTAAQLREKESGRYLRNKGRSPAPSAPSRGGRDLKRTEVTASPFSGGEVIVVPPVTVKKLADSLALKVNQVLAKAMTSVGLAINQNSILDQDTAEFLAQEFGVKVKIQEEVKAEDVLREELMRKRTGVEESDLVVRPPTVAFLGHVDHGKTTLIDHIRKSRIAENESGGITQHIGAYQVQTPSGHTLTILDTPGHEAFSAMRARGARAVDIVVLVIAADDGVMPNTLEALNHARAAKAPIVVALNKSDKPGANSERVKQQLAAQNLVAEEWGGDTAMIQVSGLKGTGVGELLERVFLESEVLELKSHSKGPASGIVLEAEVQEGKGRVAFLLIKDGTLNRGDVILAGEGYGKVRSIHDDLGASIETAGPSAPVEVSGLSELPTVGDEFYVVGDLDQAREVAEERAKKYRMMSLAERRAVTTENLLQAMADQQKKTVNLVLKADVQGSLEALRSQFEGLIHTEVDARLLHSGLGTVTESDVNLAVSSEALVLAFRVSVNDKARVAAERAGIEIRHYDVIYELLDDVRAIMEGTLAPEMTEQIAGHAEVRALFKSSKFGNIAGSHVIDGTVARDCKVRVLRNKKVVHEGAMASLRREKDDAREVREGFDCGITVKDFDAFEVGDVVEAYRIVAVKRLLKI